ncbi:dopamine beta-hydroxylase-like, partial [Ruditapes philippinarum]|uniref:dopamine beta-hydroxylase-like n=1 Tax=Ruditapes philippinarum TaxID=129788 RepID=UPI00295B40CD
MCRSIKTLLAEIYLLSACWRSVLTICPNISEYPYSVFLDKSHHFEFSWRLDYEKELVHFRVCLASHPASVFGVGFSNYGEMENSDFVIYWTSESGVHHFQDMYTDSEGIPHVDKKQDYKLEHVQTQGKHVILVFNRKFDTCDKHDYIFD